MARITVEDCIDKFESRFELVLVASQRARKLHSGEEPTIERDNDKNTVIALREIADSTISKEEISGILRTYSLYIKFPENRWDEIKIAEKSDKEGNAMFKKLGEEFDQKYRANSESAIDLHS